MKLRLSLEPGNRAVDVVAVGENSVDLVAVTEGHPQANAKYPLINYLELPGGEAASAAVGLSRLGWRAKYIGKVGDDRFGVMIRERLASEGVDVSEIIIVEDTTSRMAVILVDRETGDRTVLWRRADQLSLEPGDVEDQTLAAARVLLLGSDDVNAMTSVARRARERGARTVGDLEHVHTGTASLLRELDVVIMASTFPAAFTGEPDPGAALRQVAAISGASLVCVTLGGEGCLALAAGEELRVPAFDIDIVDTTGAGDMFRAGFIARWLREPNEPDVTELLRYANAVAALNCRETGAQTAAPRADEVEALLRG